MQDAHIGSWAHDPHPSIAMRNSIREMNHRFLDLVSVSPGGWSSPHTGMMVAVSAQVAPLSAAQRAAASNCPYALFDLRFHDSAHWRERLRGGERASAVADELPAGNDLTEFVRLALFLAWHVASTSLRAAPLLLGMAEGTAAAFRAATIDCLPRLARAESANLTERWNNYPRYWAALTAAAARRDPADLRRIQLYGLQLAAAAHSA